MLAGLVLDVQRVCQSQCHVRRRVAAVRFRHVGLVREVAHRAHMLDQHSLSPARRRGRRPRWAEQQGRQAAAVDALGGLGACQSVESGPEVDVLGESRNMGAGGERGPTTIRGIWMSVLKAVSLPGTMSCSPMCRPLSELKTKYVLDRAPVARSFDTRPPMRLSTDFTCWAWSRKTSAI